MDLHDLIAAIVILLAASAVAVALFHRLGFGSILGMLVAGVIVGPWGIGITDNADGLRHVAEIGIVFLLFVIGLEMRPERLWAMRRAVFGMGSAQILVTGFALAAYFYLFGVDVRIAVVLGLGLALSSTAFVIQMLQDSGDLTTEYGQSTFSVLLMQDLAIVPLLAFLPLIAGTPVDADATPAWLDFSIAIGAVAGLIAAGKWLVPPVLAILARQRNTEAFGLVALLSVLIAAWAMSAVNLSMELGAFIMGVMLSGSRYRHQVEVVVEPYKGTLLALFFISVGMLIDLGALVDDVVIILVHVLAIIVIKSVLLFALCRLFGLKTATAVRVALILPQCGEFGFVLFGSALTLGVISPDNFVLVVMVISMTMVATPFLNKLGEYVARRLDPGTAEPVGGDLDQGLTRHVLVAGYGRGGDTVCHMLDAAEIPFIAVDIDDARVAKGTAAGHSVHYGNAGDPRMMSALGMSNAAAVVVTIDNLHAAERVISSIRNFYPRVKVIARARDLKACDKLLAEGVTAAVPEFAEGSIELGEVVLGTVGVAKDTIIELADSLRRDNYAGLRQTAIAGGAGKETQ